MEVTFISKGLYGKIYKVQLPNVKKPFVIKVGEYNDLRRDEKYHDFIYKTLPTSCKKYVPPLIKLSQNVTSELFEVLKLSQNDDVYIYAMKYIYGITLGNYFQFHTMSNANKQPIINALSSNNNERTKLLRTRVPKNSIKKKVHQAMFCLWKIGIIHADLHLNNILIDEKYNIHLIDFGQTIQVNPLPAHVKITDVKSITYWFAKEWMNSEKDRVGATGNPNIKLFSNRINLNYYATQHLPFIKDFLHGKSSSIKRV